MTNNDSLFTIALPSGGIYPFPGKIAAIDRAVDPQTGSIKVRLIFPNPKNELKVGMSCVLQVRNLEKVPQMVVPSKAIVEQMGEYFVFIAKDTVYTEASVDSADKKKVDTVATPKLTAVQRKVQVGQTIGGNVIVLGGINIGDKILVDGVQAVHDGSLITTGNKMQGGEGDKAKKQEGKKDN